MREEDAFENLGDEDQAQGMSRGVTMTTDLATLFTTASHNVAYDIVAEASPRLARRFRAAVSKTPIGGRYAMNVPNTDFTLAGSLEELKAKGRLVVHGAHRPILVVYDRGRVFALDNRCPHMGFPLDRGSVEDGILTCHWHHARFDLESGCTFDLWADDAPTFPVEVRNDEVWVKTTSSHADPPRTGARGSMTASRTTSASSSPRRCKASSRPACRKPTSYGRRRCSGPRTGTAGAWVSRSLPHSPICYLRLPEDEAYLALFHGARRVASDCDGQPPRRERAPLESRPEPATLKRWLRRWTKVRHREAAERTLLTGIAAGLTPAALADALLAAETERAFADGGHSLDFINKAFECLDLIGWEHASSVLPTVVGQMAAARGAEESTEWRQPVDLVALCDEAAGANAGAVRGKQPREWLGAPRGARPGAAGR